MTNELHVEASRIRLGALKFFDGEPDDLINLLLTARDLSNKWYDPLTVLIYKSPYTDLKLYHYNQCSPGETQMLTQLKAELIVETALPAVTEIRG